MKKKWITVLTAGLVFLSACLPAFAEWASETDKEGAGRLLLVEDDAFRYEHNECGLVVSSEDKFGNITRFSYDMADNDLPLRRYIGEGDGRWLYEEYEYDSEGRLTALTVYSKGEEEEPTVWKYDENGRAVSVRNYETIPAEYSKDADFIWDESGRLLEVTWYEGEYLEMLPLQFGIRASEQDPEALAEKVEEFIAEHDSEMYDDKYLLSAMTDKYTYDGLGRVTSLTSQVRQTPLFMRFRGNGDICERVQVNEYSFGYFLNLKYSIRAKTTSYRDGVKGDRELKVGPIEYAISRSKAGLPVSVADTDVDIYDKLNCTEITADVGWFGIRWNDTYMNYAGELHGGPAGFSFTAVASAYVGVGMAFTLRVQGINDQGEKVVYIMRPDMMGRQMCMKFTEGRYTMPYSLDMDRERERLLTVQEDIDVFKYTADAEQ